MKRIVTGLALASAATLITAGPAQAAPKNPVAAVKKQFVAGQGVKFIDRVTFAQGRQRGIIVRRTGTLQFGASGVVASDITGKFNIRASDLGDDADSELAKALTTPERSITVGRSTYLSGGLWTTVLPEGKTWLKAPATIPGGLTSTLGQPLNIIAEPATLKTLLKGAKPAQGGYAGKITVGDLRKASPQFRAATGFTKPSGKALKSVISWKLTLDAKGLPARLVSNFPLAALGAGSPKGATASIDTRFSEWGAKVSITAPPADEVATDLKDGKELPTDLKEIPLGSIAH
ncbi:hypothetical protein [Nonomuraea lactucae]|uniref:hypothetical protein n=1 Tax=Nonomuraea lactucae TaxID=2249762 RepID=UPI000DE2EE6E|nr:hypothetical protein [Nonomuraea lactucae]